MAGRRTTDGVSYQGPGEQGWRSVESEAEGRRSLRRRALDLLAQGDQVAERLQRSRASRSRPGEEKHPGRDQALEFEAEMARAVGAWTRYATAEAKILMEGAEAAVARLVRKITRDE